MEGSTDSIICAEIPIVNDMALEDNHQFTVDIVSAGSDPHAMVDSTMSTTTVTITDDESESNLINFATIRVYATQEEQ